MKHRTTATALFAVLVGSTAMVGCSSTPTQQSAEQAVDDGVVTAKVKAALVSDPVTKAHQINVETFKGTTKRARAPCNWRATCKASGKSRTRWKCDAEADAAAVGRCTRRVTRVARLFHALQKERFVAFASA
jgi:hypothetical protein